MAHLKRYIAESGLRVGDPIPTEKTLGEQLGVSRASVREALRSLETPGIIETRHGVGRFLREFNFDPIIDNLSYSIPVNVKDFREMIDVRIALESTFIQQVAPAMSNDDVDELEKILDQLEHEVNHGYRDEQLIRVFATIQRTLTVEKKYRTSDTEEFVELHWKLIEALRARDPELARRRLIEHFKDAIAWSDNHLLSVLI